MKNKSKRIDEINENIYKYQSKKWEERNIHNQMMNKMDYMKQLKEQIKEKHFQKLLQRSINHDLRKEMQIKSKFIEDQDQYIKHNKEEAQKLYYDWLK